MNRARFPVGRYWSNAPSKYGGGGGSYFPPPPCSYSCTSERDTKPVLGLSPLHLDSTNLDRCVPVRRMDCCCAIRPAKWKWTSSPIWSGGIFQDYQYEWSFSSFVRQAVDERLWSGGSEALHSRLNFHTLVVVTVRDTVFAQGENPMNFPRYGIIMVSLLLGGQVVASAQVYVSKSGDNTVGTSWATALFSLADAVAQADSTGQDVWIDGDTFTILSTVSVPSDVNIYGGFPTTGDPGFGDRDTETYETILDGATVAAPILEYSGSSNVIIDGISFINASGGAGGAIRVVSSSDVDINDCAFRNNEAGQFGGGIYIDTAHADITDCEFEDNVANEASALMLFRGSADVIGCAFRRNTGSSQGGAILAFEDPLFVDQCVFEENEGTRGGAIAAREGADVVILNSLFRGNISSNHGAGVNFEFQVGILIANCTFVDNTAGTRGGGLFFHSSDGAVVNSIFVNNDNHAIYENENSLTPTILNNMFFDNPDGAYFDEGSVSIESAEGPDGLNTLVAHASGNVDADPVFTHPAGGDYHLRLASPAIDTGSTTNAPAMDFDEETRPVDIASIGANGVGVAFDIGFDEYLDTDSDGMPDYWEILHGLNPNSAVGIDGASGDLDVDDLTNFDEYNTYNTDPDNTDSDGDGLDDGDEVNTYSTDPTNTDTDADGVTDGEEVNTLGTNPNDASDHVWVDGTAGSGGDGTLLNPVTTIMEGLGAANVSGAFLHVLSDSYPENLTINAQIRILAEGGSVTIGTP